MRSTARFGSLFTSKILGGSVKKEREGDRERDRERGKRETDTERESVGKESYFLHKEPIGCIS